MKREETVQSHQLDSGNLHERNELHCDTVRQPLAEVPQQVLVGPKLRKLLQNNQGKVQLRNRYGRSEKKRGPVMILVGPQLWKLLEKDEGKVQRTGLAGQKRKLNQYQRSRKTRNK